MSNDVTDQRGDHARSAPDREPGPVAADSADHRDESHRAQSDGAHSRRAHSHGAQSDSTATPAEAHRSAAGAEWPSRLALVLILLFAFVLRTWNLDWDDGTHLQPDERFWSSVAATVEMPDEWVWSDVLDPDKSTLNPRNSHANYVYGTLPLWASESAAAVLTTEPMEPLVRGLDAAGIDLIRDVGPDEPVDKPVDERLRFNTGYDANLIGRLMSSLVDTATVAVVFLLARELGGRGAGLLAALLQSLTVLHIQYAHFLGSEPWVAFFVAVVTWGSVRLARGHTGWPTRIVTAVALGFAVGSKLNGAAAAVAPLVAALVAIGPDLGRLARTRIPSGVLRRVWGVVEPFLVMAVVAVAAYRLAQPYDFQAGLSLIFNEKFIADVEYIQDVNQGGNWPWVQPLVGRTPLIHPLQQVFWWGMGPGLALAAAFGCLRAARRVTLGERYWAVPLAVVGAYLVLVSFQFYAIVRYLQPAYPVLVALAGTGLVAAWKWASSMAGERAALQGIVKAAVVLSVAATAFWGLAFTNGVYGQDNARLAAGDWMIDNLPAGAAVSQQSWDDPLPWGQPSPFEHVTIEPFSFGGDAPDRIELLIERLDQVDYVVESSNKFYDSLPRTPARFPQMTQYYERLFDGSLGFEHVRTFRNEPSLFGITIDDSNAEEAFTVYDHPTVHIWRKTDRFSLARANELLNPDRARTAVNAIPVDGAANASMLSPEAYVTQQTGSSFSDVHPAEPSSLVATISWFAVTQFAALAVAPTLLRRAGSAAGAVWGFTKILGLIALGVPIWLIVSWGWLDFSTGLVWTALFVLLALGVRSAVVHRGELGEIWARHRSTMVAAEAVFLAMFLAVVALRYANPDMWSPWRGGEKPMELAYFTAVTGSTTFPPYDPWHAGGSLNYYYYGWFLLAVPTRILGIQPDVAFNLGVATYAAIAAVTAFSLAAMLSGVAGRAARTRLPVISTGLFGALLFVVVGNLDSLRQVIRRIREDLPLRDFDWWDPSRVIKDSGGLEVTEFPVWTVLFADLHPHFMAMGVFGLGLAGSFALIERARQGRTLTTWVLAGGLGVGSGVMRMVHTWDLPTFGVAAGGAIVIGAILARAPAWWRVRTAVGQLVLLGAAHLFVTAPYRARNQVADSGFRRNLWQTHLDDWLIHWGIFLFIGVVYGASRLGEVRRRLGDTRPTAIAVAAVASGGFVGLHLGIGSVAAWAFVGFAVALILLWAELAASRASTAHIMTAALWALGFAVMLGVELFTQNADINRLNTVFKFWLQIWHIFAVASAFSAFWVAHRLNRLSRIARARAASASPATSAGAATAAASTTAATSAGAATAAASTTAATSAGAATAAASATAEGVTIRSERTGRSTSGVEVARRGFIGAVLGLVLAGLLFPLLAVQPRSSDRIDTTLGPSLYGHLWLEPGITRFGVLDAFGENHEFDPGDDRPVIEWLQANARGRPTIVEGVGGAEYQWWGRISITTGLPTVLGWRWHQDQQRTIFNYEVNERKADVADFYRSTSVEPIDAFLRAYDVTYVIVGAIEAQIAAPETLAILADHPALIEVFARGQQRIYEVDKSTLAGIVANRRAESG